MSLERYEQKRKFAKTPEPRAKQNTGGRSLKFVVQKHDATQLHYDFRLEMEGVLKSWAVPKGPSLNPDDKHLAVMVEDHPASYLKFEGTIPEGNYGAGKVIVWDIGKYWHEAGSERRPDEQALLAGLKKGKLTIFLAGKKLRGLFSLVRMEGRGKNNWLLIKKHDEYQSKEDVTRHIGSAISSRRLADREASKPTAKKAAASGKASKRAGKSASPARKETAGKAKSSLKPDSAKPRKGERVPFPIKPMLTTLVDKPFDHEDWLFETKWDGYRAIAQIESSKVKLYSRNGNSFAARYHVVVDALAAIEHDCVLDGEVVVFGPRGKTGFQLLQNYVRSSKGRVAFAVFDLLFLDGYDLRQLPLVERKKLLRVLLDDGDTIFYTDHVLAKGVSFFNAAARKGLEGIIAKRADGPYRSGERSTDWLKIKTHQRQEAVIAGFTQPRGSRKSFGALILGVFDHGKLKYIGHTGTGFSDAALEQLVKKLKPLIRKTCPFEVEPETNMPATWVKPELVCEVEFTEWTAEGSLRHPAFVGLREDKAAREAKLERSKPVTEVVAGNGKVRQRKEALDMTTKGVQLTHLNKVYWPEENITKGELLAYYDGIADVMLPYLVDRPQSLNRYPGGIEGPSFFQKDFDNKLPSFMKSKDIYSESKGENITWLLCQNKESLLYIVNLGCIELNPWNSCVAHLDKPDYMVLDLDPDDNSFEEVVALAQLTHRTLEGLGIPSYPKTSGQSGMHIYIPLAARYTHEDSRRYAKLLAGEIHTASPDNTSLERSPAKRRHMIYIDYLQNRTGQTLAAPYSARPWPGATVSAPLKWTEVRKGLSPAKFTISSMPARLKKVGDLWKPVLAKGVDLEKALKPLTVASS